MVFHQAASEHLLIKAYYLVNKQFTYSKKLNVQYIYKTTQLYSQVMQRSSEGKGYFIFQ